MVELEVDYPREIVAFMEPRAALASYDGQSARYTLQVGAQSAHQLRTVLAKVLGVGEEAVRVIVPDVGGGFGARNIVYPEFVLALFAARALGRPVKWVAERSESFTTDAQARSQRLRGTLGLDAEGRFTALGVAALWRHGGYLTGRSVFVIVSWMAPMICGPYRIPAYHFALRRRVHQHHADRGLPRHRAGRAHLSARAPGRRRGAPDRDRPDRAAPPQPDRARGDALALADRRGLSARGLPA